MKENKHYKSLLRYVYYRTGDLRESRGISRRLFLKFRRRKMTESVYIKMFRQATVLSDRIAEEDSVPRLVPYNKANLCELNFIGNLPLEYRELLLLCDVQKFSLKEVSYILHNAISEIQGTLALAKVSLYNICYLNWMINKMAIQRKVIRGVFLPK